MSTLAFALILLILFTAYHLDRKNTAHQIWAKITEEQQVSHKNVEWLLHRGLSFLAPRKITQLLWFYARKGDPLLLRMFLGKAQARLETMHRLQTDDLFDECFRNCQNANDALISLFEQYGTHFTIEEAKEALNRDAKRTMTHFSSTAMEALTDHPYLHAIGQMIAERGWVNRLLQLYKDKLMPQRTAQACLNTIGHGEELYKNHFTELTILMLFADDKEDSQKLMQWLRNEIDKTQDDNERAAMRSSIARLFALQVDKVPRKEAVPNN